MDEASTNGTTTTATNGTTPVVEGTKPPLFSPEQIEAIAKALNPEIVKLADIRAGLAVKPLASEIHNKLGSRAKKEKDAAEPTQATAPTESKSLTMEDLLSYQKTSKEIGKLEAAIGEEAIAKLPEEYQSLLPQHQLLVLRIAAEAIKAAAPTTNSSSGGENVETQPGRDARPKTSNPRGEASQTRDSSPRPRTILEWHALKKTNPAAHEAYMRDPSFDPKSLPYK